MESTLMKGHTRLRRSTRQSGEGSQSFGCGNLAVSFDPGTEWRVRGQSAGRAINHHPGLALGAPQTGGGGGATTCEPNACGSDLRDTSRGSEFEGRMWSPRGEGEGGNGDQKRQLRMRAVSATSGN